ncbi:MAG TPA: nitrile hydratase subunit beta [Trebonia sp.]
MDGIHDLGGMDGFGAVAHSPSEPVFRERWEADVLALTLLVLTETDVSGGEFRTSIERMDPAQYLSTSYYEHVLTGAATLAVNHGLASLAGLETRAGGRFPLSSPPPADSAPPGSDLPCASAGDRELRFGAGDRVRVREFHSQLHTRCPRYVRGKAGVVIGVDGVSSLPDADVRGVVRREAVYSVRFSADELWRDGQRNASVTVSLWDSYLEEIHE